MRTDVFAEFLLNFMENLSKFDDYLVKLDKNLAKFDKNLLISPHSKSKTEIDPKIVQ